MLKRIAFLTASGAPHSALISHHRRTPTKICKRVTRMARAIQPRLATLLMRETSSTRLTLRSARYSNAAEIRIFVVEIRIRRISPALVTRTWRCHLATFREPWNLGPWYGFGTDLAIGLPWRFACRRTCAPQAIGVRLHGFVRPLSAFGRGSILTNPSRISRLYRLLRPTRERG